MRIPTVARTGLAVVAAAALGTLAAAPGSRWYETLDKPSWQPPKAAFPLVWTPLYASLAIAGARAIDRAAASERTALIESYGTNLILNAGWTAVFFRAHKPRLALAEIVLLNASNIDLLRRMWKADRPAGAAIVPYVAWTGLATALTASIARRNPDQG